ncbi:hypothetical protein SCOCK_80167 [Actinacidiphila cocklensis]|uniref:Uncharacterized protein n=1 Tax=Actinacidiphila cocklensis TaxID=887465 RepID=A0A9W4GVW4_9ACTN|nr:hypothetical protein SCOCK_80167 [Actinacidiphila cocklensis]
MPPHGRRPERTRNDHGVQPDEGRRPAEQSDSSGRCEELLRPPPWPGHALHDRDVGALQLLRHARAAAALPDRRRAGRRQGLAGRRAGHDGRHGHRHLLDLPGDGLPARHAGRLVRRPGLGSAQDRRGLLGDHHGRPPDAGAPRRGAVLRRPGPGGDRLRAAQGQHLDDGRAPLRRPRRPPQGRRLHRLLHGHQRRRLRRAAGHRHRRPELQLAPGLRAGRGGHGAGPVPVPAGHPAPQRAQQRRPQAAEPRRAQRDPAQEHAVAARSGGLLRRAGRHRRLHPELGVGADHPDRPGHPGRRPGAHQPRQGADEDRAVQDERLHLVLRGRRRVLDDLRPGRVDDVDLRRQQEPRHPVRLRLPLVLVPVGEPAVDHGAGAGHRMGVGVAGAQEPGARHHGEVRDRPVPDRRVVPRLHRADGDGVGRHEGQPDVAGVDLHDPDRRRAGPVPGRPVGDHEDGAGQVRQPDDGRLVPGRHRGRLHDEPAVPGGRRSERHERGGVRGRPRLYRGLRDLDLPAQGGRPHGRRALRPRPLGSLGRSAPGHGVPRPSRRAPVEDRWGGGALPRRPPA